MCPDPQLLSIYIDGEMPSPWKEKLEAHLAQCSKCKEKLDNYKKLQGKLFDVTLEQKHNDAKDRVWEKLQSQKQSRTWNSAGFRQRDSRLSGLWRKRFSIPMPAAAAAVILIILAAVFISGGFGKSNDPVNHFADSSERANIIFAAEDMPVIPMSDLNSVFQYLVSDGTDIIILRLPESRSFSRSGDPTIVRAADYRRFP